MKISLDRILGLLGLVFVAGFALAWFLFSIGVKVASVNIGPFDVVIPTSQPQTPMSIMPNQIPTSDPQGSTLEYLGALRVLGNSRQGLQIQMPKSGAYRFVYQSGAYSTYPINTSPPDVKTWLTAVLIFRGDKAEWDGEKIKHESALIRLADTNYWATAGEAERSAKGQYMEANLNRGDVLTFIGVDDYSWYADNPGQIVIEWYFLKY